MGHIFKYFITICFSIFLIGCNLDNQATSSPPGSISEVGAIKHWRISTATLPLHLSIDSSFSTEEKEAISDVKEEWNRSELDFNLLASTLNSTSPINTGNLSSYRDSILGIYKVTKWFPEIGNSALAITQFFAYPQVDTNGVPYYEIVHADVLVNFQDHDFSLNPQSYSGEYDLKSVVVHELGHLLGLGHVNDWSVESVMLPSLSLNERRQELYSRDIDDIDELYDNTLTSTTKIIERLHHSDGEMVRGIIELKADGHCQHYWLPIKKGF